MLSGENTHLFTSRPMRYTELISDPLVGAPGAYDGWAGHVRLRHVAEREQGHHARCRSVRSQHPAQYKARQQRGSDRHCSLNVLGAMLSRMDARQHDDLIFTISQAILDARYAPPKRRRSAWGEGYNEDLEQARRVAAAIVEALRRSGFQISRKPPAPHHSTPKGP